MSKRIEELYAFVSEDAGGEGVTAFRGDDGWMPLVGADIARVNGIRALAQAIADQSGRTVRLLRFTVREELEVLEPAPKRGP